MRVFETSYVKMTEIGTLRSSVNWFRIRDDCASDDDDSGSKA